jgi:hypothetical protein
MKKIKKTEFSDKQKEKILKFIELTVGKDVMNKIKPMQIEYFFEIAKLYELNPFKKEIYLIPYEIQTYDEKAKKKIGTGEYTVQVVIGYQIYIERAEATGKLNGWRVWTEGEAVKGNLKAFIEIHRKDWKTPLTHEVDYNEYNLSNKIWKNNLSKSYLI